MLDLTLTIQHSDDDGPRLNITFGPGLTLDDYQQVANQLDILRTQVRAHLRPKPPEGHYVVDGGAWGCHTVTLEGRHKKTSTRFPDEPTSAG